MTEGHSSSKPEDPAGDLSQINAATEDAFCEYLRVRTAGADDFDAFCLKHPELDVGLRALHDQWSRVHLMLERLGGSVSITERLKSRFGEIDPKISLHEEQQDPDGRGAIRLLSKLAAKRPASTRYDIRGELGRGGMGVVYKVWDEDLRRQLAMKVVTGKRDPTGKSTQIEVEPRRMSRFLEEAQITGQLDHPGILPVHELGIDPDGRVYFTMRLVEGRELREVFSLSRKGEDGWSRTRVLGILLRVLEAMAFAHSKGVIHRDIKPANIMVGRFGAVYVMDWGLAKVLGRKDSHDPGGRDSNENPSDSEAEYSEQENVATDRSDSDSGEHEALVTMDGDIVGTPSYMPPEQASGHHDELGPRADVYSVGAMLYELLTGQMPYEPLGERVPAHTILNAVRTTPPWPVLDIAPDTQPELVAICEKAMARSIEDRYSDMSDFASDLRAYLEGHVVAAYESGVAAEVKKWVERNRVASIAAVALLFVLIGSIGGFIWQQRRANVVTEEARDEAVANLELAKDRQAELEVEKERVTEAVLEAKANLEEAQRNKEEADLQANTASKNALQAQIQSKAAKHKGYLAGLTAADYSLRLGEVKDAKRSLAACERSARGWEWEFLNAQSDTSVGLLEDLSSAVFFAEFVGEDRLVSVADDHKLRLTRIESGVLDTSLTMPGSVIGAGERLLQVRSAALAPGGRLIAVSTLSNVVSLWDLRAPDTHLEPAALRTFVGHDEGRGIYSIAISADGRYLASCSSDLTVRVFDFKTAESLAVLEGLESPARTIDFSPTDSSQLAIGGSDATLRIWGWDGDGESRVLRGHTGVIHDLDWSPDGTQVATVSTDQTLRLWNPETGQLESTFHDHSEAVTAVDYGMSKGELRIVTGSKDTTVRLWDPRDGRVLRVFAGHEETVRDVQLAEDGTRLMSAAVDGTVRLWSLVSSLAVESLSLRGTEDQTLVLACAFDGTGDRFLTAVEQAHADPDSGQLTSSGMVQVWTSRDRELVARYETPAKVVSAAFVDNDRSLAVLLAPSVSSVNFGMSPLVRTLDIETIRLVLVSAETGEYLRDLSLGGSHELFALAANRQGTRVAVAGEERVVLVIDVESGEIVQRLEGHRRSVHSLAFSPDGRFLASGSRDKTVRVWDLETGESVRVLRGHRWQINVVRFDESGSRLVSGSNDRTARIWDLQSGDLIQELVVDDGAVYALGLAPSGDRVFVAGGDSFVRVFEPEVGEALLRLRGHTEIVRCLDVHPDGQTILSTSDDGTVRIWQSTSASERTERKKVRDR